MKYIIILQLNFQLTKKTKSDLILQIMKFILSIKKNLFKLRFICVLRTFQFI